jgi:hypothetical protein
MNDIQFERLIMAINRNTDAQIQVAQQVLKLADECVQLATLLADPEGEAPAQVDMAGRPIRLDDMGPG